MKVIERISNILILVIVASCNNGPQPISYSEDACHFCRMTIVDKQHAAQIVTEKGRNYKYDAIECMVNDLNNWDRPAPDQILVSDYSEPGKMINASDTYYLISKNIPSPMGAYLSAFKNEADLDKALSLKDDKKLDWYQLLEHFKN